MYPMTVEQRREYVAALEREREGYERTGKVDRASQVTAEIERARGSKDGTVKPKRTQRVQRR